MDPAAKKVSIAIIVILVATIGMISYSGIKKYFFKTSSSSQITSSSTPAIYNVASFNEGRKNLEEIILAKIEENPAKAGFETKPSFIAKVPVQKLIISNNTDQASIKAYGLAVSKAMSPLNVDRGNETASMLLALENQDVSKAAEIKSVANAYQTSADNLLKISVPKSATQVHLSLVNSLKQSALRLNEMSNILSNPYLALTSADIYRVEKIATLKAVDKMNQYFRNQNIIFTESDSGKIYLNF